MFGKHLQPVCCLNPPCAAAILGECQFGCGSAICLPALSCTPVPCLCWSRYFLSTAEDSRSEFADLRPGQLSGDMRAALGLGPLDPPPWLQRMRELGYPPGWRCALIQNPKGCSTSASSATRPAGHAPWPHNPLGCSTSASWNACPAGDAHYISCSTEELRVRWRLATSWSAHLALPKMKPSPLRAPKLRSPLGHRAGSTNAFGCS